MKNLVSLTACLGWIVALLGCAEEPANTASKSESKSVVDGSKYVLDDEPEGAKDVIQVREDAKDGDEVVIVGRIGGSKDPWVEGRAAFTLVDNSLRACSDIPGDQCPVPWDYCCETDKLPTSTAFIKVVDENGELVDADARDLLNVKELSTIVVKGKAQRDDDKNLTVHAHRVYVKKK